MEPAFLSEERHSPPQGRKLFFAFEESDETKNTSFFPRAEKRRKEGEEEEERKVNSCGRDPPSVHKLDSFVEMGS